MNWVDVALPMANALELPVWFALAVIDLALRGQARLLLRYFGVNAEGCVEHKDLALRLISTFGVHAEKESV